MASSFSFPLLKPAQIVDVLHSYGIELRAQDIGNPQPGFLAEVLNSILDNVLNDVPEEQLQFQRLQALDSPQHHERAVEYRCLYQRANAFLQSIRFQDLTLRDLLRADGHRVTSILSAIVNFLHHWQDRLTLLQPIIQEYTEFDERQTELGAKIAELRKAKEDHLLKQEMEAPEVQQFEKEINALKHTLQEYNKEQLALRCVRNSVDSNKAELLMKIKQADFELMKVTQEKERLAAKIVHSPEKFQRNLEEKKAVRVELKNLEKVATQKVLEKTNTLETYTKASEKLGKHLSKISAVHEKSTDAKASEKEVKAHREKISDQNLAIKAVCNKAHEWQLKVLETEANLNAKEKERDQRVAENNRKMTALKSKVESEHSCLEDKERKTNEKIDKGCEICSQADSVTEAANKKVDEIYTKYNQVIEASNIYMDGVDHSFDETDEAAEVMLNTVVAQSAA